MHRRVLIFMTVLLLALAACGGNGDEPAADDAQPLAPDEQDQPEEDQAAAIVETAESDLGTILVDADGNTLYMFVPDQEAGGEPTCYDDCAEAWPALEADGDPAGGDGIDGALLDTVERTDGATQVTYNDLPLYLFSGDEAPGDTNGQGLNDAWFVLSPDGEPVMN